MKKGVSEEIYTGTVRTFYDREKAEEFVAYCNERGYRTVVRETDYEGARWAVTVLNRALPDQTQFKQ